MSVREEFRFIPLNPTGEFECERVAELFSELLAKLDEFVVAGRPRSVMVTKLQEAKFWAVRAVSENPSRRDGNMPLGAVAPGAPSAGGAW